MGQTRLTRRLLFASTLLCLLISILVSPDGISKATAWQAPSVTTSFNPNQDTQIFPSLTIAYTQGVQGAQVRITGNYLRGYDTLKLKYAGTVGLSTSWDSSLGLLTISGTASGTEYQNILASVYFSTTSQSNVQRTIYWNLGVNVKYFSGTGHYYLWVSTAGRPSLSWTSARADCSSRNHLGLTGYLATLTSSSEFSFILQLSGNAAGWIGASDSTSANTWRWLTGPEGRQEGGQGLRFYYSVCRTYWIYNYFYY